VLQQQQQQQEHAQKCDKVMSGWSDGYKLRHDKNITLLYIALMASPVCEALLGIRWYQILSGSGIVPFLLLFLFASTHH